MDQSAKIVINLYNNNNNNCFVEKKTRFYPSNLLICYNINTFHVLHLSPSVFSIIPMTQLFRIIFFPFLLSHLRI